MRTQQEIIERAKSVNDFLGTQISDLVQFLEFENAKEFLNDEYIQKVISGEEEWEVLTDAKAKILGYLEFAYNKAENQRGISAGRSMLHFKTWIWLDDPDFYGKIIDKIDDYTDYGIPALDEISKHYGYVKAVV